MINKLIKALEIKASMAFNLFFANKMILLYFFSFLIIDLCFLIPAVIAQNFYSNAELVMPIEIQTKGSKAEIETHPIIADAKIDKCSI